jgi:hypothetical protein
MDEWIKQIYRVEKFLVFSPVNFYYHEIRKNL